MTPQEGRGQQLYQGMKRVRAGSLKKISYFKDKMFQPKTSSSNSHDLQKVLQEKSCDKKSTLR